MQNIERYIEQLTRMELKPEALQTAIEILEAVPQIQTELENPSVSKEKKEKGGEGREGEKRKKKIGPRD